MTLGIGTRGPEGLRSVAPADLREWIQVAGDIGQLRRFRGAHWDLEIGAITEFVCTRSKPWCLLFDEVPGYPPGRRVLTNVVASKELATMILGLSPALSSTDLVLAWRAKAQTLLPQPASEVRDGPVLENVSEGSDVDLYQFPSPRWHANDGGRYLGTGCVVVTRDPDNGQINLGCYRMMIQDRDKVGLYISPGKHGRLHRDKYFAEGKPMPVVAAFGMDPLLQLAASLSLPMSVNEYEWAGAVRGEPSEVVKGPVTGLPIPAQAEIAIEGYVHADPLLDEGPFGEWTGYYASAVRMEPYVQVEALYYRDNAIILGNHPMRPPGDSHHARRLIKEALIWDALEAAGIPDVRGVRATPAAGAGLLVISIKPRYAGHATQAATVAAMCRAGAYLGRYIVVVDDDVDIDNIDEVLWALWTRSDPEESLDLVRECWSTPLDPRIPPERRARGQFSNSRLIIDATRPYYWREAFPPVARISRELEEQVSARWANELAD